MTGVTQLYDAAGILSRMEARIPEYATTDLHESTSAPLRLLEEALVVTRKSVVGETVRVAVTTEEHAETIDETLHAVSVEVEHVPIGRYVDAIPPVREEGDLTILPVVEEVLVIERRLLLREEIHIRRVHSTTRHIETIVLRTQHPTVTRHPAPTTPTEPRAEMGNQEADPPPPSPV